MDASQKSRIHAGGISCIKCAWGMSELNKESNESMYERFGMGVTPKGAD